MTNTSLAMPDAKSTGDPAGEIRQLHGEILGAFRDNLAKALRIGQLLSEQKAALAHGEFGPWVAANLPFTDRSARNYMHLWANRDRLGKTETVSDLTGAYRLLTDSRRQPDQEPEPHQADDSLDDEAEHDEPRASPVWAKDRFAAGRAKERKRGREAVTNLKREKQMSAGFRQAFELFYEELTGAVHEEFKGQTSLEAARMCLRRLSGLIENCDSPARDPKDPVGMDRANKAIAILNSIPNDDPEQKDAEKYVIRWIRTSR